MIPQMTVVADLARSEDELSLKPGYAVGDAKAPQKIFPLVTSGKVRFGSSRMVTPGGEGGTVIW